MTGSDHVIIEIPCKSVNNNHNDNVISAASEWFLHLTGTETTKTYERERYIQKVPPLLLKTKKGRRNRECYKPRLISLGPYHHNQPDLAQAENYKNITLEIYRSGTGKSMDELYNNVLKVVHDARKCYIDGSTDAYTDHEFNQMMLRDACFILFYIEAWTCAHSSVLLNNEYLGSVGFVNITRDIFLLENQIPFIVLEVLLNLKFPEDNGEGILNKYFNYLNYGEVMYRKDKKALDYKRPLHLLELYRSYFISLMTSSSLGSTKHLNKDSSKEDEHFNYLQRSRSFASVTQLKERWIFLTCKSNQSTSDMEFNTYRCYGEFKLARRAVSSHTKAMFLNMIAYEMCPHNPNDFRISTYLRVMKSLIVQQDDVCELRRNGILLHNLGSDEEVVKVYDEIEVPSVNLYMYNQLRLGIERLNERKYKTWAMELITDYFGSPWKALGSLVAAAILVSSFVQTYLAVKEDSNGKGCA